MSINNFPCQHLGNTNLPGIFINHFPTWIDDSFQFDVFVIVEILLPS
jgi:hypothetical protein